MDNYYYNNNCNQYQFFDQGSPVEKSQSYYSSPNFNWHQSYQSSPYTYNQCLDYNNTSNNSNSLSNFYYSYESLNGNLSGSFEKCADVSSNSSYMHQNIIDQNRSIFNSSNEFNEVSSISSVNNIPSPQYSFNCNRQDSSFYSNEKTKNTYQIKDKYSKKHQLPDLAIDIMNEWFDEHINNPYPTIEEKERLAQATGITVKQVTAWFSNRRNRSQNTKPKRMKRLLQNEINELYKELVHTSNKEHLIEKIKKTLVNNL